MSALPSLLAKTRKLFAVMRTSEYRRGLRYGVAASIEHERIPLRRDFQTVLDAGANRGQFALFARQMLPGATLLCFEPLAAPRRRLERVTVGSGATIFDVALGARAETASFHVSAADDSSSLLSIGARQREAFPGTEEREQISVRVRRLDEVIDANALARPVLLKVDVQGGELALLQGAEGVLGVVDAMLIEASFVQLYEGQPLIGEVWKLIAAAGFTCRGIWSITYGPGGVSLQADFLFAREGFEPLSPR